MNRVFTTIGDVNDISGFFQKYNTVNNTHFTSLFGTSTESDIEALDYILSDVLGGKVLIQKYADIYNKSGADVLMGRIVSIADKYFYNNWLSFKQSIETALNSSISKPLESEKTIETQKTGNNETQNKLNAFDSSTASDTDRADNRYTDNFSTIETTHYSNGKTPAENAKKQIDFTKNNDLIELIINDVVSICCIDVYDDNYICSRISIGGGESDPELENRVTECENRVTQCENRVTQCENRVTQGENDITDIKKLIPATATEHNKLATMADIGGGGGSDPELENRVTQCENDITDIKKLIPATATEHNKLATIEDIQSGYDDTELRGLIQKNTDDIQGIYNDLTGYATKQELQAVENSIPDVANLATKTELQEVENSIPDVTNLATKQELQAVENSIPDVANLATKTELQEVENSIPDVTNLATKQELQAVENSIPDVTNLATKTEVQSITDLIPSNASTQNKLATMADIGGGGGGGSYYTVGQEVDTGNIYKDGSTEKPIYRRVVNVSKITQGSDVDVNVYFAGATRFINITGSYNLNGIRHGIGYYNQSGTKGVQAEVRMSLVRFSVMGAGLTFTDVTLIIEYIK